MDLLEEFGRTLWNRRRHRQRAVIDPEVWAAEEIGTNVTTITMIPATTTTLHRRPAVAHRDASPMIGDPLFPHSETFATMTGMGVQVDRGMIVPSGRRRLISCRR